MCLSVEYSAQTEMEKASFRVLVVGMVSVFHIRAAIRTHSPHLNSQSGSVFGGKGVCWSLGSAPQSATNDQILVCDMFPIPRSTPPTRRRTGERNLTGSPGGSRAGRSHPPAHHCCT